MNKEFCIQCGHKNIFEVSKPRFCAGCGNQFNTLAKANSPKEISQAKNFSDEEDDKKGKKKGGRNKRTLRV